MLKLSELRKRILTYIEKNKKIADQSKLSKEKFDEQKKKIQEKAKKDIEAIQKVFTKENKTFSEKKSNLKEDQEKILGQLVIQLSEELIEEEEYEKLVKQMI